MFEEPEQMIEAPIFHHDDDDVVDSGRHLPSLNERGAARQGRAATNHHFTRCREVRAASSFEIAGYPPVTTLLHVASLPHGS
jgi:hypothetical protein